VSDTTKTTRRVIRETFCTEEEHARYVRTLDAASDLYGILQILLDGFLALGDDVQIPDCFNNSEQWEEIEYLLARIEERPERDLWGDDDDDDDDDDDALMGGAS
jgi:hypothetical protein